MSINRTMISGNLTRDADLRSSQSGTSILNFSVAVNDRRRNPQTGEWEDYANFVDCVMFGTRADSLSSYLLKGTKVAVEGKLRWSQWEKDGQKRSKLEVVVDEIEFMSRNAPRDQSGDQYGKTYSQERNQAPSALSQAQTAAEAALFASKRQDDSSAHPGLYDEDIPF